MDPEAPETCLSEHHTTAHFSVPISSLLSRLLFLRAIATDAVEKLPNHQLDALRLYYNHALVARRAVVADVTVETWKTDLVSSLAAVLFARERVEARELQYPHLLSIYLALIEQLCTDVEKPWFHFVIRNARRPTMIAMPSLPALNLGVKEERFYVQSVSDSWPSKQVSHLEGDVIKVNPRASRRFVNDLVAGDLGDVELQVTEHERSFIEHHSIGWITRYESVSHKVTIIEIDPWAKGEISVDLIARKTAHELVKVKEQRLDAFKVDMKLHEDDQFADNLVLSRLLAIDQSSRPIHEATTDVDIEQYIHVSGSLDVDLGPLDEEVFLKSLGSMTAKNKVRSALAISTKARLSALNDRGFSIRAIQMSEKVDLKSRMIRSGVDGIYVKTRVPTDSILVLFIALVLSTLACYYLVRMEGVQSLDEVTSVGLGLTLGLALLYHNLRYKAWPLGETVRLRRMCASDEEMSLAMSRHEVISTVADAGSKGAAMDGILTCAFSDSRNGKFSVTQPLSLEEGAKVGLKLRLSTALRPLWVDLQGVRAVEQTGMWHAYGSYLNKNFLELTMVGPEYVGAASWPRRLLESRGCTAGQRAKPFQEKKRILHATCTTCLLAKNKKLEHGWKWNQRAKHFQEKKRILYATCTCY